MRLVRIAFIFLFLTVLTQIGGVVYLAGLGLAGAARITSRIARLAIFLALYAAATVAASHAAPSFGRVPLPCFSQANLQVRSPLYCALNRNYATTGAKRAAEMAVGFPGTVTLALDANFPFLDGFPLLPHLSHADGRKLDIAFFYRDEAGRALSGTTRSPIGYFAFEAPGPGAPLPCEGRNDVLTLRWDMAFLQDLFPAWTLDEARTGAALRWLAVNGQAYGVERIFIEPHLSARLGVSDPAVRFQGCRAARHDDHIHFQVKE